MNIYDIAKEANVSIATVSRVLNGSEAVSQKTRDKVMKILDEYKYSPSAIARGLAGNSMKTVGVLAIDIRSVFYATVAYTIEQELSELGYNSILCNTGGDSVEKLKYLKVLTQKKVDGIILIGSGFKDNKIDEAVLEVSKSIPVIMINSYIDAPNIYSIICDDGYGIEIATKFLIQKERKKLIYIWDGETYSAMTKKECFIKEMANNGLQLTEHSIIKTDGTLEGAIMAVSELFRLGTEFDGIIAGEDLSAVGAAKAVVQNKRKVPKDVAIIGFNNSVMVRCFEPEITSVDNKMELLGMSAVRLLIDLLNGREVSSKTIITPSLSIKGSV